MHKVSVIVPNFNHAKYLSRRLESISNQTYKDFDLTILDDASTDDSMLVIDSFMQHFPAKIIINKTNSGSPFKQWNFGIQQTEGEYIWLAEADDDAKPEFLASLVNRLDSRPELALAYCDSFVVDGEGLVTARISELQSDIHPTKWLSDYIIAGHDECSRYLICRNIIPNASGVLFRRSFFLKAGGACEELKLAGDWMTWVKLLMLGEVAYVAEPLNLFRTHDKSVRHRTTVRVAFEEALHIRCYIKSAVNVAPDVSHKVSSAMRRDWEQALWRSEPMPTVAWFLRIWMTLRRFYPDATRRMIRKYAFIRVARVSLLAAIKHRALGPRYAPRSHSSMLNRLIEHCRTWTS